MITLGFIPIGHNDYINDNAKNLTEQAVRCLKYNNIQVIWNGEIVNDSINARKMAKDVLRSDVDGIILFMATWMECPVAMSALREFEHLPFALWGTPMFKKEGRWESTGSFVSFAMFKGSLDRLGYMYKSVCGLPEDNVTVQEVCVFAKAANTYQKLKRSSIGLIGYTSMSIYPGTFDHLLMRKIIGPEIEHIDNYTLINMMKNIKDEDCNETISKLKSLARIRNDVSKEDLLTVSKMYLALMKICTVKDLEAINVKCQYELSKEFGMTACVPLSLLSENKIVAACEGDIPVTVSMLMLHRLSASITAYADFININDNTTVKLSPCGFIPYSMGYEEDREIRSFMPGVGFKGIQNSFVYKTGCVTLLRLVEDIGDYHFVYGIGEGLPTELRQGYMPALDIKIKGDVMDFIRLSGGQHYAMCYGDLTSEIEQLAKIMRIKCLKIG